MPRPGPGPDGPAAARCAAGRGPAIPGSTRAAAGQRLKVKRRRHRAQRRWHHRLMLLAAREVRAGSREEAMGRRWLIISAAYWPGLPAVRCDASRRPYPGMPPVRPLYGSATWDQPAVITCGAGPLGTPLLINQICALRSATWGSRQRSLAP
jgi:hypothetical protein